VRDLREEGVAPEAPLVAYVQQSVLALVAMAVASEPEFCISQAHGVRCVCRSFVSIQRMPDSYRLKV
jgi:hypothetical protein